MLEPTEADAAAWRQARAAAARAGVTVTAVYGADVVVAQRLIRDVWGPQQVPQENLLRALAHAGSTLLVARRGAESLGVVLGFLGWTGGIHLHSHMTAVVPGQQSRGVGYALKLWQRAVCLGNGVDEIRWTYDPLIARNAYFNLVKLGAEVVGFEPDFYGAMDDTVNAGDHSDRFEVAWRLRSPRVVAAIEGRRRPEPSPITAAVAIPADYDDLRRRAPDEARRVRLVTRSALLELFHPDRSVEWVAGGYVAVPRAARERAVAGHQRDQHG